MSTARYRWLGLDPSLVGFGWCALGVDGYGEKPRLLGAGLFRTEKDDGAESTTLDRARRLYELGTEVDGLLQRFEPVLVGVESLAIPYGRTSLFVVQNLGRVRGLVDGLCLARHVPLIEVNPMTLKHFVTGSRSAEKEQVLKAMVGWCPDLAGALAGIPKSLRDNPADAAAVARWAFSNVAEQLKAVRA